MKKIINLLTSLSLSLLIIFFIYIIIGSLISNSKNELFKVFGYSLATTPTDSMKGNNPDNFDEGEIIIITDYDYDKLEIGDVIVFKDNQNEKLIIHRIVGKDDLGFITKGDNNPHNDLGHVNKKDYQGKYLTHYKFFNIGLWINELKLVTLSIVMIILIVLLIKEIKILRNKRLY